MKILRHLCNHRNRSRSHHIIGIGIMWVLHTIIAATTCIIFTVNTEALSCSEDVGNMLNGTVYVDDILFNISHDFVNPSDGYMAGLTYKVMVNVPQDKVSAYVYVTGDDPGSILLSQGGPRCNQSVDMSDVTGDITLYWEAPVQKANQCVYFMLILRDNSGNQTIQRPQPFCHYTACYAVHSDIWGTVNETASGQCIYVIQTNDVYKLHLQYSWSYDVTNSTCITQVSSHQQTTTSTQCIYNTQYLNNNNMSFVSDSNFAVIQLKAQCKDYSFNLSAIYYSIDSGGNIPCSKTYHSLTASLQSFTYPYQYLPNQHCTTDIIVSSNYRIFLQIQFINLPLQNETCDDFILVDQGESMSDKICGNGDNIGQWQSSSNSMSIVLHSNNYLQGIGFLAFYTSVLCCEDEYFSTGSVDNSTLNMSHNISSVSYNTLKGTITSVNYPQNYLNNQNRDVVISCANPDCIIHLLFHYIDIHTQSPMLYGGMTGEQCHADYIEVDDGDSRHRLCGHWFNRQVYMTSNTSILKVHFHSDNSLTAGGYLAQWATDNIQVCPDGWTPYMDSCLLFIDTPLTWTQAKDHCRHNNSSLVKIDSLVMQQFINMQLVYRNVSDYAIWIGANDRLHEGDYVWADGSKVQYFHWFKGFNNISAQPSDDGYSLEDCIELRRKFMINSKTDQDVGQYYWNDRNCRVNNAFICQRAIQLVPESISKSNISDSCDKVYSLYLWNNHTSIASPYYPDMYDSNTHCNVTVHVPKGYVITVSFRHFHLEDSLSCKFDWIEINDRTAPKQGKKCGDWNSKLKLLTYISYGNKVTLSFNTDNSVSATGFLVDFILTKVPSACDKYWLPKNDTCVWVPTNKDTFMQAEHTCFKSGAHLTDKETLSYINDQQQPYGNNRTYWIKLSENNDNTTCKAMKIQDENHIISLVDCNDTASFICHKNQNGDTTMIERYLNTSSGLVSMVTPYPANTNITWILHPPFADKITFQLTMLTLEYQKECLYDRLTISGQNNQIQVFCGNISSSTNFELNGNVAIVTLTSDWSINDGGFELYWQAVNTSLCDQPLIYTKPNGTITSLNYPYSYPNNISCLITIKAPLHHRIRIKFVDIFLNVGEELILLTGNATLNVLAVLNNFSLTEYLSYGNELGLYFSTDSVANNKGFAAMYEFVNYTTLDYEYIQLQNDTAGVITSINYPYNAPSMYKKTWRLLAPYGYNVHITDIDVPNLYDYEKCTDKLILKDPHGPEEEVYINVCGDKTVNFTSQLNELLLSLHSSDTNWDTAALQFNYNAIYDNNFNSKTVNVKPESIFLTECSSNHTCQHDGVCMRLKEGYQCQCFQQYTGVFCQKTYCDTITCQNNGACINGNLTARCVCAKEYTGRLCETSLIDCNRKQCFGHGDCDVNNLQTCFCYRGWTGDRCSNAMQVIDSAGSGFGQRLLEEPFWIGIIVIGIVLLITGLVILIRKKCLKHILKLKCCIKRKKKKKKDTGKGNNKTGRQNAAFQTSPLEYSRSPSPKLASLRIPTIMIQDDCDTSNHTSPQPSIIPSLEVTVEQHLENHTKDTIHPNTLAVQHISTPPLSHRNNGAIGGQLSTAGTRERTFVKRRPLMRQFSCDVADEDMLDVDEVKGATAAIPTSLAISQDQADDNDPSSGMDESVNRNLLTPSGNERNVSEEIHPVSYSSGKNSSQRRLEFAQSVRKRRNHEEVSGGSLLNSYSSNSSEGSQALSVQTMYMSYDMMSQDYCKCDKCRYKRYMKRKRLKDCECDKCFKRALKSQLYKKFQLASVSSKDESFSRYSRSCSCSSHHHHRRHHHRSHHHHHHNYNHHHSSHSHSSQQHIDNPLHYRQGNIAPSLNERRKQRHSSSGRSMSMTDFGSSRSIDSRQGSVCSRGSAYSLPNRKSHRQRQRNKQNAMDHHKEERVAKDVKLKRLKVPYKSVDVVSQHVPIHRSKSDTVINRSHTVPTTPPPPKKRSGIKPLRSPLVERDLRRSKHNSSKNSRSGRNKKSYSLQVPSPSMIDLSPKGVASEKSYNTVSSGVFLDSSGDEMEIIHNVKYEDMKGSTSSRNTSVSKGSSISHSAEVHDISGYSDVFGPPPSSNKRNSVDSAYQSKEQSTEHYFSKPSSSTVSPTSLNGTNWLKDSELNIRTFVNMSRKHDDTHDNKIKNQLELAAHKLHMIQDDDITQYGSNMYEDIPMQTFSSSAPSDSYLTLWLQQNTGITQPKSLLPSSKHRRLYPSRVLSMIKDEEHEPDSPSKSPIRLSKASSLDGSLVLSARASSNDETHVLSTKASSLDDTHIEVDRDISTPFNHTKKMQIGKTLSFEESCLSVNNKNLLSTKASSFGDMYSLRNNDNVSSTIATDMYAKETVADVHSSKPADIISNTSSATSNSSNVIHVKMDSQNNDTELIPPHPVVKPDDCGSTVVSKSSKSHSSDPSDCSTIDLDNLSFVIVDRSSPDDQSKTMLSQDTHKEVVIDVKDDKNSSLNDSGNHTNSNSDCENNVLQIQLNDCTVERRYSVA